MKQLLLCLCVFSCFMLGAQTPDPENLELNYHLMHPGEKSFPGDPNAAFYIDGVCHLHYIIEHKWNGKNHVHGKY